MFTSKIDTLKDKHAHKYKLRQSGEPLSYGGFLNHLQEDEEFRSFFINLLHEVPFKAYHWETPPVQSSSVDQPFEFVVSSTPGIDIPPAPGPFRQYFNALGDDETVTVFDNLGRDAKLVAPAPAEDKEQKNYSHIGVFTDQAPADQQHALWQKVGEVTREHISDQPLWLNTAGGGVAWLHVRLDSRPKYYRYVPYCN